VKIFVGLLDQRFRGLAGKFAVGIYNISPWDAADLEVQAIYRDGSVLTGSSERLAANDVEPFGMDLRSAELRFDFDPALARVVVRYSDAQRIARYESRQDYEPREDGSPAISEAHEQILSP
jgi:hypothetical protein